MHLLYSSYHIQLSSVCWSNVLLLCYVYGLFFITVRTEKQIRYTRCVAYLAVLYHRDRYEGERVLYNTALVFRELNCLMTKQTGKQAHN